jgi:hypothetical protein
MIGKSPIAIDIKKIHEILSLRFGFNPGDDLFELFFDVIQGLNSHLSSNMKFVSANSHAVDEEIVNIVDERVLVVGFGNQLQHVLIVFLREVKADDVEAVVEEGGEDAGLRVFFFGGDEDVV